MRNRRFTLAFELTLILGMAVLAVAQYEDSCPPRVSSFSISIRRNQSTRNLLALRMIWS
jgi:hypothetical protein